MTGSHLFWLHCFHHPYRLILKTCYLLEKNSMHFVVCLPSRLSIAWPNFSQEALLSRKVLIKRSPWLVYDDSIRTIKVSVCLVVEVSTWPEVMVASYKELPRKSSQNFSSVRDCYTHFFFSNAGQSEKTKSNNKFLHMSFSLFFFLKCLPAR